jgi:hypothetical protein
MAMTGGDDMRDQSFIKWFAFVDCIMNFSEFAADLNELRGDKAQPAAFQTGDDFPN